MVETANNNKKTKQVLSLFFLLTFRAGDGMLYYSN
jgi:hypothetical protein